jgi:hypothetical protein
VANEPADGDFMRCGVEVRDWAMVAVISICRDEAALQSAFHQPTASKVILLHQFPQLRLPIQRLFNGVIQLWR